ncbi:MAG: hypothetical protein KC445_10655 [Anaerolineales bacterium]|nr:hypothetical protein [Anaerolineales bacterium]
MYQSFHFNRFFLILLFLVSAASVSCQDPTPTAVAISTPRKYSVRVVDAATQLPIVNAAVTISKSGVPLNARTDSNGVAAFDTIKEDDIEKLGQIIVEAPGYERYALFIEVSPDSMSNEIPLTPRSPNTAIPSREAVVCQKDVYIFAAKTNVLPDETVILSATASGRSLEYEWVADRGWFKTTDVPIVQYTAPSEPGDVTITVTAREADCADPTTAEIELKVLEPTVVATQVVEETSSPEGIPTLTATATRMATTTETVSPTATLIATAVPRPEYNAPVITQLEFLPGGAVYIVWVWDGELTDTQNFAVRFWSEADQRPEARFSITWTKEHSYQFGVNNIDFPEGTYLINVAVMEGPSEGYHYALAESTNERVFVTEIKPTEKPPTGP